MLHARVSHVYFKQLIYIYKTIAKKKKKCVIRSGICFSFFFFFANLGIEAQAPLAVQSPGVSSSCSPRGYHTPMSEEAPRTILQVPTPISAIMTTMDGYLEPQRMSFSSPPNSELNPRYPICRSRKS